MDRRRRAATALLALAACIACSAAAPTSSDHTALDLYEGTPAATEGCYYNFQHYGEGDRIMTNEPCLNCTCHNRMLMCYLRVCPFTKAIGQDCTVEKRADQCCPIVTCPDVPVDLLTSTSTTSPAEYGGTGLGKVDNYGCSINGKYFPEGAKVPPTPNKPCEHCYCIRNMTTCVMQECTLHVDGCTPIYHKDVCCPVRYFCDHPEDEIPLLDDMTTTVRPTPGFLLTTTTEEVVTQTQKRECIENDQLYPDGALIKTEKPCVHCYCMKGDIVCVVQECGTPMENEGKNCTSLPPREGQCCPDTYICEGDESTTESATETPYKQLTTLEPPRRAGVEGSGYRNEPDEVTYTEMPPFVSDIEGSGEEPGTRKPTDSSELYIPDKQATEESIQTVTDSSISTSATVPEDDEKATTEPDKGLNTIEEEVSEPSIIFSTTPKEEMKVTQPTPIMEQNMVTSGITIEESSKPSLLDEITDKDQTKITDRPLVSESDTQKDETEPPKATIISEQETKPSETGASSEPSILQLTTLSDEILATIQPITEQNIVSGEKVTDKTAIEQETVPSITESYEPTKTPPKGEKEVTGPTVSSEQYTPSSQMPEDESLQQGTTHSEEITSTEAAMISEENAIPSEFEKEITEPSIAQTTTKYDINPTIISEYSTASGDIHKEGSTEPSALDKTTVKDETKLTESTVFEDKQSTVSKEDENITTEPTYRKEYEEKVTDTTTEKEVEKLTTAVPDFTKATAVTEVTSIDTIAPSIDYEHKLTTTQSPDHQLIEETSREPTTPSLYEVSDVTKPTEESATSVTTSNVASEVVTSPADEKQELPVGTTINLEDNEISEDVSPISPPGRIPGEGDCLLNGITYSNDSSIPSNNKCHSGCKCISSIVKCDPIICSPQPEYMDNCQPIYDTPESCCPTYVCDHSRETIPPQSHSQMSGTESPLPSPSIECNGDQCDVSQEKEHPSIPTEMCSSGDCDNVVQKPIQSYPSVEHPEGCTDDKCTSTKDVPQLIPAEPVTVPQACENPENCKETHTPETSRPTCEGGSCIKIKGEGCKNSDCEVTHEKPCEGQNCEMKPEITPAKITPQVCENQDDCKDAKIPEEAVPPCKGASCTEITIQPCDNKSGCDESVSKPCEGQNCEIQPELAQNVTPQICENQDDCRETKIPQEVVSPCEGESCTGGDQKPSLPSHDEEICAEESGCKKPEEQVQECTDEVCRKKQTSGLEHKLSSECTDPECLQKPIHPGQEPTISTESPITSEPITEAGEPITEQEDHGVKLPEPQMTHAQETQTEVALPTLSDESVTVQTEQTGTDKPYKFSELPEPSISEKEEASTRIPEEITTKEFTPAHDEHLDTENKLPETFTQESGSVTELPEIPVTEIKSEDVTKPSERISTEKEEQVTELTATEIYPDKEISSKPAEVEMTSTDSPQITESQGIYTVQPEESVTEHKDMFTMASPPETEHYGLPETHVTESEEITQSTEVKQPEKTTEIPEFSVTSIQRETEIPEQSTSQVSEIVTKSPLTESEQEVLTEVQKLVTEQPGSPVISSEHEVEPTTPSIIESHESSTDRPHVTDVSQDISTESSMIQDLSTKASVSPEAVEQQTELPKSTAIETETQTELPTRRVTAPEDYLTDSPHKDIDTQTSTEISVSSEKVIETSTLSAIFVDDESKTKAPESYESDDRGVTTEKETLPQIQVTQLQEISSTSTEKIDQQPETYTEFPSSLSSESEEYDTKTPKISITEEEKVHTDSPISHVTESQQTYVTPSMAPLETDLTTKMTEPSVLEEETKTEKPESQITETEKTVTETPEQHTSVQEEESKVSDQHKADENELVPAMHTDSPLTLVTDQKVGIDTLVTEQQEAEESPVTEKEEIKTEPPMLTDAVDNRLSEESPSSTEKDKFDENEIIPESPYVPSHEEVGSETPVSLFTEKESVVKMTEPGDISVTESTLMPEQPGKQEIYTELPVYISTGQQELGTSGPDNIETESPVPATVSTDTKIPLQTETPEIITKLPEFSYTEEIPASSYTQEPSEVDHKKETTETLETIIPDQVFSTESPAVLLTHQESVTESELHDTIPNKEITKSPEVSITEHGEIASTKSPVPDVTELEEIITKVPLLPELHITATEPEPFITGQEFGTKAPEKEYTTPQELEIKTEEPSLLVTKKSDVTPTKEDVQTETPIAQETDTVPEEIATEYHEPATTEQSVITTKPSKLHDVEIDGSHSESPDSAVTESLEIATKKPEEQELDQKESKPTEIAPTETPHLTESSTEISTASPISESIQEVTKLSVESEQTTRPSHEYSETTPYLVELEEHPHKVEEEMSTALPSEAPTTVYSKVHETEPTQIVSEESTEKIPSEEIHTESPMKDTQKPYDEKEETLPHTQETFRPEMYLTTSEETPEKSTETFPGEGSSRPEVQLTTVSSEETPKPSSESMPIEEPRPELHQTTLSLEESSEKVSEPTPAEEPSKPGVYQTTSVSEEATEKSSEPTSVEEPTKPEDHKTSLLPEEIPIISSETSVSGEETTSAKPTPSDLEEPNRRFSAETQKEQEPSTPVQSFEEEKLTTPALSPETEKPAFTDESYGTQPEKDIILTTSKPLEADVVFDTTAAEEEFIPAKTTTAKVEEKDSTQTPELPDKFTKPEEKPSEVYPTTPTSETSKPSFNELQPTDEVPSPEDEAHFPPSGGYGQEPDYVEEDQAFGPGTCRYGGKVYVSAQQIPRDDPCDFCFCFRSDIICLQQSCPPPIHGCHEEPIQGFCCPRYECPVSMATTLNVTTTTTTTTTTLPPHFLPHAYKGAAQRRGCQIKGHTYKVGEVVRASSGPCLHCTCGGDGQMKCDPKVCTPEPMLRQMIAAAVSSKRRR